jgi:hypothetical protein
MIYCITWSRGAGILRLLLLTTLDDTIMDGSQAAFEQDDLGGIFCHINGAGDRDTDISSMKRRGVIDAITHKSDDMAAMLEREDDAVFLCG